MIILCVLDVWREQKTFSNVPWLDSYIHTSIALVHIYKFVHWYTQSSLELFESHSFSAFTLVLSFALSFYHFRVLQHTYTRKYPHTFEWHAHSGTYPHPYPYSHVTHKHTQSNIALSLYRCLQIHAWIPCAHRLVIKRNTWSLFEVAYEHPFLYHSDQKESRSF